MERLQASEVATLVISLVAAFLLVQALCKRRCVGFRRHALGTMLVLAAYVFTIVEGFVWNDFFNFLEHFCLMAAGLVFLAAAREASSTGDTAQESRGGSRRVS